MSKKNIIVLREWEEKKPKDFEPNRLIGTVNHRSVATAFKLFTGITQLPQMSADTFFFGKYHLLYPT